MDSTEKLQQDLELLRRGLDIQKEVPAPLSQQLHAQVEATVDSLLSFAVDTSRRLAILEKMDVRLAALERSLSATVTSHFPRVESRLSQIESMNQRTAQTVNDLSTEFAQKTDSGLHEVIQKKVKEEFNKLNEYKFLHRELVMATNSKKVDKVRQLIASGANVNSKSKKGKTVLSIAALNGHIECMTELLNAGADIAARNADGFTALQMAVIHGKVDCQHILEQWSLEREKN